MAKATISKGVKTKTTWANALKRDWQLYLLLMIPVALVVIFNYASYGGIRMVFMDYKPAKGYAGSKWVGWATFQKVFKDKDFIRALKSSIVFNLLDLAVGFPMPIILALILNELRFPRFKKVTQTILYLPHFLSWVVLAMIFRDLLDGSGIINSGLMALGIIKEPIVFLGNNSWFQGLMIGTDVWKEFGYGAIIFIAALTSINTELYEAAAIDGAGRLQRIWHITLPGIAVTIVLVATLNIANILNAGFDQIYNLYSPIVYSTGDIIDTFVYRLGLLDAQYGPATAVGLFKSVISTLFISISYFLAYKLADYRIF